MNQNNFSPINITQANINFFYKENNNLKIRDANFKYHFSKNENKGVLKGKFLGDSIYFSFEENKVECPLCRSEIKNFFCTHFTVPLALTLFETALFSN